MTALLRECVNVWRKRLFNRTDHLNEDAGQNSKGNRHWEDQVVAGHADQSAGNDLSLIHISEPTRQRIRSRMPSSA